MDLDFGVDASGGIDDIDLDFGVGGLGAPDNEEGDADELDFGLPAPAGAARVRIVVIVPLHHCLLHYDKIEMHYLF